tara:strand:+ start:206 stop:535 length:330 start_codon:yes stop_codon:yes gene_type:complete
MTKREKNIKEIFKDLKGRISGLPHLRNNPAVVEVKSLMIILDELETAFVTHLIADEDESCEGLITKSIKLFKREGEVKANVVKQFLLEEHKIDIGLTALQERINRINAN